MRQSQSPRGLTLMRHLVQRPVTSPRATVPLGTSMEKSNSEMLELTGVPIAFDCRMRMPRKGFVDCCATRDRCYDIGSEHATTSHVKEPGTAPMSTSLFRKLPRSSVFILLTTCGLLVDDLKSDEPSTSSPASMPDKEAGQVRNDNWLEMELVWCPPGKFKMGSPDSELKRAMNEGPQVEVKLTKGFWLGKCEVTQGQWESLKETTPWDGQAGVQEGDHNPATFVNWEDATEFCETRGGCQENGSILCPRKRNGNMPVAPVQQPRSSSVMTCGNWETMPGLANSMKKTASKRSPATCMLTKSR